MTSDRGQRDRQIIPRWNLSWVSSQIGDTMDLRGRASVEKRQVELLRKKRRVWDAERSVWAGIDLVGTAMVLQVADDVRWDDALSVLRDEDLSYSQKALVGATEHESPEDGYRRSALNERVRALRVRLIRHPRDSSTLR